MLEKSMLSDLPFLINLLKKLTSRQSREKNNQIGSDSTCQHSAFFVGSNFTKFVNFLNIHNFN